MIAFITSKGTLDKANSTVRKYIAKRAELIGAIRLPNTAFKENAGTSVTSDIIFLQKRERMIEVEPDWVHLGLLEGGIPVNQYFLEYPQMMLGYMEFDTKMFGEDSKYTTCVNHEKDFDIYNAIVEAGNRMSATFTQKEDVFQEVEEDVIPADPDIKNYTFTFVEDNLYYRENSVMRKMEVSSTAYERIRGLDEIRHITRKLIQIQTEGCSNEELQEQQALLNQEYDAFTKKYKAINNSANARAFRDDSDYPLLCSLEVMDKEKNVTKADMFYKQTIKPKVPIEKVETAVEALNVSMNEFGTVNISFMLNLYQMPREKLLEELRELIFLEALQYDEIDLNRGWKTARAL